MLPLRDEVMKSLESARQEKVIGAPLEAVVRVAADDSLYGLLEEYKNELPGLFIVSEVVLSHGRGRFSCHHRTGGWYEVRTLLEVHP